MIDREENMLRLSTKTAILASVAALAFTAPVAAQTTPPAPPAPVQAAQAAAGGPDRDLEVVSWGGTYTRSQMLAYVKPYRAHSKKWVWMRTYNGGLKEIRDQVATENVTWDVVDFELSDLIKACREGLLEKIDHATLPAGSDGTAASDDFVPGAFTDCGVGQTIWSTVVAYNADRVGDTPPSGVADFFDLSKYPGKRGLRRDPRIILEWALIADGVAPDKVYAELETDAGLERAFDKLDRIRRHIVWWSDGEEPAALLDSGAVVMTSVWNGRMFRPIVTEKKNYKILWDGHIWDIDSWGIVKGTDNLDKALDFVRFSTGTGPLAEQAKYIPYGPARKSSMALIGDDIKAMLPTAHMDTALQSNAEWWATHHAALKERFERWYRSGGTPLSGTAR